MNILSCAFNMDTACVELKMADGTMISKWIINTSEIFFWII